LPLLKFQPSYICIPRSFLVINVCNHGKTLCSTCRSLAELRSVFMKLVTQVQMQYSIQPTTPERLLPCCTLLLHNTIASTNPTLFLQTKDMPSHRRRFYTHNFNGIDLQKKNSTTYQYIKLLCSLQLSLFYFLRVILI